MLDLAMVAVLVVVFALLARLRAAERRAGAGADAPQVRVGALTVDLAAGRISGPDDDIRPTRPSGSCSSSWAATLASSSAKPRYLLTRAWDAASSRESQVTQQQLVGCRCQVG